MQQRKSDTDVAAESQSVFSSQDEAQYFPSTTPHGGARDAELSSYEALILDVLIQAVLNSNKEEIEAIERSARSAERCLNSSLSR